MRGERPKRPHFSRWGLDNPYSRALPATQSAAFRYPLDVDIREVEHVVHHLGVLEGFGANAVNDGQVRLFFGGEPQGGSGSEHEKTEPVTHLMARIAPHQKTNHKRLESRKACGSQSPRRTISKRLPRRRAKGKR